MNGALYALSVTVVAMSLLIAYITLAPLTVLKNWTIVVDGGTHYAGETITVQSIYTKVRKVTGTASRYLDCRNVNGTTTRYPVNQAKANRAPGVTATGLFIKIPDSIPNLPTRCHVTISIDYSIYSFRTVTETNSSADFVLAKALDSVDLSPPPAAAPTSLSAPATGSSTAVAPSPAPQSAPVVTPTASSPNNVQPASNQPSQAPKSSSNLLQDARTALQALPLIGGLF